MANRSTRFLLKNSTTSGSTLPLTALKGEPLVNLYEGIMYFSGISGGNFTTGNTNTDFFEVGSKLTNLKLKNRLTEYESVSGSGLVGKFLSGTTDGFVLANVSGITGIDTYVTGFTYDNANTLTISQNQGQTPLYATINNVTGLTVNGDLYVSNSAITNNLTITGTGIYNNVATGSNLNEIVNYSSLTGYVQSTDIFVTGGTSTGSTTGSSNATIELTYSNGVNSGLYSLDYKDTYTTGGTYNSGTTSIDFNRNDGVTYSVDLSSIDINNTFVTGFTYSPSTNTFTIYQNQGESPLPATISEVSGLTVNGNLSVTGLGTNRVVYTTGSGQLTTESNFTYDQGTDILGVTNIEASGDVTIQGSLTVFGPSISAFTTNLYVEDPNITLNYNPTGSTTITSVNSGFVIQDGSGVSGNSVNWDIVRMQNLSGVTVGEYTGTTGYDQRGWITQLNDIVIRSTDVVDEGGSNAVTGVRVLAEGDILDGGSYS
jgi:hypothetical protein